MNTVDRSCNYCGFHFNAAISYAGRPLPRPTFGRYRSWCCVKHRAKSYRIRRKRLQQQELLRRYYAAIEARGQLRFFSDEAP